MSWQEQTASYSLPWKPAPHCYQLLQWTCSVCTHFASRGEMAWMKGTQMLEEADDTFSTC